MRTRNPLLLLTSALLVVLTSWSSAGAQAPFTLDELFRSPWPFGSSPSSLAVSDDGRYIACGWDAEGVPSPEKLMQLLIFFADLMTGGTPI